MNNLESGQYLKKKGTKETFKIVTHFYEGEIQVFQIVSEDSYKNYFYSLENIEKNFIPITKFSK